MVVSLPNRLVKVSTEELALPESWRQPEQSRHRGPCWRGHGEGLVTESWGFPSGDPLSVSWDFRICLFQEKKTT